jgi:hypothetical protein
MMSAFGMGDTRVCQNHLKLAARDTEDVVPDKPRWMAIASGIAAVTSASLIYAYS